ncbi:MAG: hypothetical protein HYV54_01315 [Parcubacteria group bacterium]|nr:hypothetical protein [Parcubacteria group bacterium]
MVIRTSSKFRQAYKRLPQYVKDKALEREDIFRKNPFDSRLDTHKLHGKYKNYWSFTVCASVPSRAVTSASASATSGIPGMTTTVSFPSATLALRRFDLCRFLFLNPLILRFTAGDLFYIINLDTRFNIRLASFHNVYFFNDLMERIRGAIKEGKFEELKLKYISS